MIFQKEHDQQTNHLREDLLRVLARWLPWLPSLLLLVACQTNPDKMVRLPTAIPTDEVTLPAYEEATPAPRISRSLVLGDVLNLHATDATNGTIRFHIVAENNLVGVTEWRVDIKTNIPGLDTCLSYNILGECTNRLLSSSGAWPPPEQQPNFPGLAVFATLDTVVVEFPPTKWDARSE